MNNQLSAEHQQTLIETLQHRFEANPSRHAGILWNDVHVRLKAHPDKLYVLSLMEETQGEPDVVGINAQTGQFLFVDCAPESPKGRRSVCYDDAALESRKEHKPRHSAMGLAKEIGIELLTEQQYRELQQIGSFDLKTSSWIATPESVRKLGGALFCDRRYGQVFTYHNGAESYYAARGFRGALMV